MSVLYMKLIEDDHFSELNQLLPNEKIFEYDLFWKKTKRLVTLLSHYFSLLKGDKVINVVQGSSRLMKLKSLAKDKVINIFINHGWGVKKSPGRKEILNRDARRYWRMLRKYTDYVICYSEFDQTYFMRHELLDDLPFPKFIPLGHPRNDFLVRNSDNYSLIKNERMRLGISLSDKVILFAPTHRDSSVLKDDYDKRLLHMYMSELEKIDRRLSANNIKILFRPHYYFRGLSINFKNVILATVDRFRDPRMLMLISDILVTDYSSIYVDYLLLQKPIAFYQPDLDYYQEVRGLVVDPNDPVQMPGPKISRLSDILDLDENEFKKYDLRASRAFFHKYFDDKATKRLADFLLKLIHSEG